MGHPVVLDAEKQWDAFADGVRRRHAAFFEGEGPILTARAPGRLDVMGGVLDYSGGVVLELPIARAAFAAVQLRSDRTVRLRSVGAAALGLAEDVTLPPDTLFADPEAHVPATFAEVGERLRADPAARWTAYVAGCLYVLIASGWLPPEEARGVDILVESHVPSGAGVSSSAALEVAAMAALVELFGIRMDGMELAALCQIVENRVVGVPSGIMDQVAANLGRANCLTVLKCQPHELLGCQRLPAGWQIVGIDSAVKHSVGGRAYARARVGAAMGLKIIQTLSRDDWGGYLSNVPADVWRPWRERVPETMAGAEFLASYHALPDPIAHVDPDETYDVRACTEHHVLDNDRVREFLALLQLAGDEPDAQLLAEAGLLMLESHRTSSDQIGLGSPETDLIVSLAMDRGPTRGIFGAKMSGGGSGGAVAVLCGPGSEAAIDEVAKAYREQTGIEPLVLTGSSPGAADFGARRISL